MTRRALLVGINEFKERLEDQIEVERSKWKLGGCVNDVRSFKDLLSSEPYGLHPEDEILVLENDKARRRDILQGLDWLLDGYKKDGSDVRLFLISSHGTFVADQSGDECDGRDEVIVPHIHDWKKPFRDDALRERFDTIPPNVNFTFIADCCHGGTIQEMKVYEDENGLPGPPPDLGLSATRNLDPPMEVLREVHDAESRAFEKAVESGTPDLEKWGTDGAMEKKRYGLKTAKRHVLLAACRADQTAAELERQQRGAFTWAIEKAIKKKSGKLTYKQLIDRVGVLLQPFGQEPQLECPENWLSLKFLEPLGPGGTSGSFENQTVSDGKEQKMSSNLVKFLAQMGKSKGLMKKGKMKKSLKNLTDEEIEILKSGDADRIEGWVAAGGGEKPIDQHGGG